MLNIKEKLVELLEDLEELPCCATYEGQADYLIANGVTILKTNLNETCDQLESNLKVLESATDNNVGCKWISVDERLPEWTMPPRDVLVYHDLGCGMFVDRAWYSYEKNKWMSFRGMNLKVTHWMHLPEPPKGE